MQENDFVAMLHRIQMHVMDGFLFIGQRGQLKIMRRKQRKRLGFFSQMIGAGPSQRQAVKGTGAAADFVHQDQAFRGRVMQDIGGFRHFHHKRGATAGQVVGRADTGENLVDRAAGQGFCRDITADMGD